MKPTLVVASRLVIACVAVLGGMALGAGAADAGTGVARSFSFSPSGGFVDALAAAVDQANGDVYVSDAGANSVWAFEVSLAGKSAEPDMAFGEAGFVREPYPPGEPQRRSELNVPFQPVVDGEHNILVPTLNDGRVRVLFPDGGEVQLVSPITDLAQPTGVGVDGSGNIYVSQLGGAVREFTPAGRPVNAAGVETSENTLLRAPTGVRAIAVSSSGEDIYLASEDGAIQYHLSAGAYVEGATFGEGFTAGVAVAPVGGPAAGDVFVEAGGVITDYEPSGKQLASFGQEQGHALGAEAARLAVYSTPTGAAVFAPNRGSVEVYETFPAPTLTTQAATEVQRTTATVNATVNPEGITVTGCFFEYGAGERHACDLSGAEIGTADTPVAVSAKLEGLEPGASYPLDLVVEFEGHTIASTASTLKTPPLATATTGAASNVTGERATLNATVDLLAGAARYHFQYIQEGAAEPRTTEEQSLAVGEQAVAANLTGLVPGKRTFFRVVVVPEAPLRPIEGGYAAIPAKVEPPVISNESASTQEQHSAHLTGAITPEDSETTYYFEYAAEEFYLANNRTYNGLTRTGTIAVGEAGKAPLPVAANVGGLAAGTVYHYRLVATNAGGTTRGPDQTFAIDEASPGEDTHQELATPVLAPVTTITPAVKPPPPTKGGKGETRALRYAREVKRCKKIRSTRKRAQCLRTAKAHFSPVARKKRRQVARAISTCSASTGTIRTAARCNRRSSSRPAASPRRASTSSSVRYAARYM